MRTVEDYEAIHRACYVDKLSIRAIHRNLGYDRETIRKAIVQAASQPNTSSIAPFAYLTYQVDNTQPYKPL